MIDYSTPTTLTYNTVGELLTVDATAPADDVTYTWNAAGQMVGVQKGTQNITYQYNGFGQRVAETINGVLTRQWVWCGSSATPCEERDAQGYLLARYFPQGEQRITGIATPVVENLHYLRDRLGSVIGLTDATGTLISRLSYDIWGRPKLEFGTTTPAFGFAGMLLDQATGLYQTWRRPYDPYLARWLSRDPLEDAEMSQGPNLYAYVGNNPVNKADDFGLRPKPPNFKKYIDDLWEKYQNAEDKSGMLNDALDNANPDDECESAELKKAYKDLFDCNSEYSGLPECTTICQQFDTVVTQLISICVEAYKTRCEK